MPAAEAGARPLFVGIFSYSYILFLLSVCSRCAAALKGRVLYFSLQNNVHNLDFGRPVCVSFVASLKVHLHTFFQIFKGAFRILIAGASVSNGALIDAGVLIAEYGHTVKICSAVSLSSFRRRNQNLASVICRLLVKLFDCELPVSQFCDFACRAFRILRSRAVCLLLRIRIFLCVPGLFILIYRRFAFFGVRVLLLFLLLFLIYKPVIYAANVAEDDLADDGVSNAGVHAVREYAKEELSEVFVVCAQIEQEIAELEDDEKKMFLEDLGLSESGLEKLIKASYRLLGLISYLTAGEPEVRAWTITEGTKAPQAAGKIHSDFERGFIRAEVVSYDDLMECGSHSAAKEKGLVRLEGKDYVVKDGDIMLFRFNV